MANNDGFIDFLSPNALADLKEGNALVLTSIENVKKLNQLMSGQNTPGASGNATNALTQQLLAQQNALAALQRQYTSAAASQRQRTQQTAEEAVNQGILNRNARQAAILNSNLAGSYQRLATNEALAARALQDLIARGRTENQTLRSFNNELTAAQSRLDGYRNRLLAADEATGRWGRTSRRTIDEVSAETTTLGGRIGNALGYVFERVRILAYILPGLGIAGIFGLALDPLYKLIDGLDLFSKKLDLVSQARERFNQTQKESLVNQIQESENAARLFATITDENKSREERLNAAERLKKAYPGYLANFTKEEILLNQTSKATEEYTRKIDGLNIAIKTRADAKAKETQAAVTLDEIGDLRQEVATRERLNDEINKGNLSYKEWQKRIEQHADVINDDEKLVEKFGKVSINALGYFDEKQIKKLRTNADNLVREYNREKGVINNLYRISSLLDFQKETPTKAPKTNFDPNGSETNARLRYLKEVAELTKAENENEKKFRENQIAELEKLAKDEKRSFNDRIASYGEFIKLKQDALLKDQASSLQLLKEQLNVEQEQSLKAEEADLKRAGNAPKQVAAIKKYYADEAFVRTQKYAQRELEIEIRVSKENQNIAEETAQAIILINQKRREIIAATDKTYRDEQSAIFKKNADNEKLSVEVRQRSFESYIELKRKELDIDKNVALAKAGNNDEEIKQIKARFEVANRLLNTESKEESPFAKSLEYANNALKDLANTFKNDFLSSAGMGSLAQIFDGTFDKVMKGFDQIEDSTERFRAKATYAFLVVSEVAQEAFNLIAQASKQNFDAEYEQNTRQASLAKQFAEGNAVAIAEIEKQEEARRKEIRRRELKANRDLAKANILINSAQGIVAAFKDGNIIKGAIFAAVIAGITAIQLSALNNVPEYWKGTDNAPGGYAWVDERGPEIHTDKHGNVKSTGESKANLRKLEKGDKIIPHMKSKALMFDNGLNKILYNGISGSQNITVNSEFPIDAFNATASRIENAVSNIPGLQLTDTVLKRYQRNGNQRTIVMNDRMSRRGKTNP